MSSGIDSEKLKEINQSATLKKVKNLVRINILNKSKTKTGNLWINLYQEMVAILKTFIKSERTGNWKLNLKTVVQMLPYFASAGHNNYLKSAYLYTQKMYTLEQDNPGVYQKFMSGNHVVRRKNTFWAGLSTDLVIEQELMRSMKASCKSISLFNDFYYLMNNY